MGVSDARCLRDLQPRLSGSCEFWVRCGSRPGQTLHISGKQVSLLSGLFFLGYFAFQMPGASFANKRSASWLVFVGLIGWGTCAALTGVIRIFWLLAVDRFLLGVAESAIFPALLILLTRWFTSAERSRANTFLILGNPVTVLWMSAITGYLIQGFGWQRTFILEGMPSIIWATVWILFVKDQPGKAKWITADAAAALERATPRNRRRLRVRRVTYEKRYCDPMCWRWRRSSFLEHRRVWFCALAAVDCPPGERAIDGQDRPALGCPLPGCGDIDGYGLTYIGPNAAEAGLGVAIPPDGGCGTPGFVSAGGSKFRAGLLLPGHPSAGVHVCALWLWTSFLSDCRGRWQLKFWT